MNRKPKVALDFVKMVPSDKTHFGDEVVRGLGSNSSIYTTPNPSLTALQAVNTDLNNKIAEAANGDIVKIAARDQSEATWEAAFRDAAYYVEGIADGSTVKIVSSGFHSTLTEFLPVEKPEAPVMLAKGVSPAGAVHAEAQPLRHVNAFLTIAATPGVRIVVTGNQVDLIMDKARVSLIVDTHRKVDFHGLDSLSQYIVQMFAVNTAGMGDGSDPVTVSVM